MLSLHQTYLRHLTIYGIYLGTLAELKRLLELLATGRLRPAIAERLPLSEAVHAHRLMESSQHVGKLILLP
jgi:NADPH:quinone reductase-like Zn-dependent oxidoreductase